MKERHPSYAFLTEMLWVCAFFLVSACIFVLVFAKSERLSRDAETLNLAVQAASNAMEDTFALYEKSAAEGVSDFQPDTRFSDPVSTEGREDFSLEIDSAVEDRLLSVTVRVIRSRDLSVIYELTGDRFLSGMAPAAPAGEGVTP